MARKVLLEGYEYTFTPATRTIVIPRYLKKEKLILITDVAVNKVLYNFSDPSLGITSYSATIAGDGTEQTTIVLATDTTSLSASDDIQILVDDEVQQISPIEAMVDPTNKQRVTTPQALIDTDFEYGVQSSKWESIGLTDNRPYIYPLFPNQVTVNAGASSISIPNGSKTVTVNANAHGLIVGTPIIVLDTYWGPANGNFIVETSSANSFTYSSRAQNVTGSTINAYDSTKTLIYQGAIFSQAAIGATPTAIAYSSVDGKITVTTSVPHGLALGNEVAVVGTSGLNQNVNGNQFVAHVLDPVTFAYYAPTGLTGTLVTSTTTLTYSSAGATNTNTITMTNTTNAWVGCYITGTGIPANTLITRTSGNTLYLSNPLTAQASGTYTLTSAVYARPQSQFAHRAYDGGVLFSTNSISSYVQATRQTRRYFRYQSGKAIQMSSGTVLKPYANVDVLTASGTTVTVQTRERHNVVAGTQIQVYGSTDNNYNGTFTVTSVPAWNKFTYTATSAPTITPAPGNANVSIVSWYGAKSRLGIFDTQNGLFWEFDGQTLYAVRRSSTFQIAGRSSITNGSTNLQATDNTNYPTAYSKQLSPGDYIVIKGVSYRVTDIISDTSLVISPAYRGPDVTNAIVSKTVDTKTSQANFNIDTMNGSGPSGYNIDLGKMQMFYIDYTWYGAGFIRWGVRGPKGNVMYSHKLPNNNINTEAYMRSGNLPARYEILNFPPATTTTASIAPSDTTITVADTSQFPSSGTLWLRQPTGAAAGTFEYVNYTGKTSTTFTGLTRAQAGAAAQTFTTSANSNVGTVASTTGIQIGQRVINPVAFGTASAVPDNTFVTNIVGLTITLSNPVATANPSLLFAPMSKTTAQTFTYSVTNPTSVELGWPSFAPALSHWGTSVIMDGRYDDDKSLLFTYGQQQQTALDGTFGAITVGGSNSGISGAQTIVLSDVTQVVPGMTVFGTGIGTGATVTSINNLTKTVYLSVVNSGAVSGNILFYSGSVGTTTTLSGGGSGVVTLGVASTSGISIGQSVYGTGVGINATVISIPATNSVTVSVAGTGAASGTGYFINPATTKALFSIRIAPSVDGGQIGNFGAREIVNRMQLILRSLDLTTTQPTGASAPVNVLLTANLNGIPVLNTTAGTSSLTWKSPAGTTNVSSSLAQIADYAGAYATVLNGELTGGFFTNSTNNVDLTQVRDLGNSIVAGGNTTAQTSIFPDGPDTLTILATNLSQIPIAVAGRLSWTEAQA